MDRIKPLVSIIIPTYNRAGTIERSIRSVLNQTYSNFELIVVDDASADNTESVISGIKDERIRYLRHESNKGGGAARNTGIKAAEGDYIAFQDSDDEWLPQKLDKQMKVFESCDSDIGVVYSGCLKFNGSAVEYFPDIYIINSGSSGFIHEKLLRYNLVTTVTAVVKSECLKKAGGFDERLPRLQDWELFLRVAKYYKFKFINESLVNVYYTSNSITFNDFAYIEAMSIMLKRHKKDFIKSKAMSIQIGILARYAVNKGDLTRNFDYIIKKILSKVPIKYSFLFVFKLGSIIKNLRAAVNSHETIIAEHRGILERYRSNYNMLSKWFANKSEGKTMQLFFKDNRYIKVAVYGAGDLGLKLYNEINSLGVAVTCFIDNNLHKTDDIDNIKILRVDELVGDEADIVIVTPTYDFDRIKNELNRRGLRTVISLEEVINSMC